MLNNSKVNDLGVLIHSTIVQTGVNPSLVYCSVTGRPIGRLDDEIFDSFLSEFEGMDLEEACDELMIRTVCAARPSPLWNSVTPERLVTLSETRQAETISYLLNRLYERDDRFKITQDERVIQYLNRIKTYEQIDLLIREGHDLGWWLSILLEVEAKLNLRKVPAVGPEMTLFDDRFVLPTNIESFKDLWEKWFDERMKAYAIRAKQIQAEIRSRRNGGSNMSFLAFINDGLMNPHQRNRAEARRAKEAKAKPQKAKLRTEKQNFLAGLLESIMNGNIEPVPAADLPTPKPETTTVIQNGKPVVAFKLAAFAKKD